MSLAEIMDRLAARGVHKSPLAVVSEPEGPRGVSEGKAESGGVRPHPDPEARAKYERLKELEQRMKNCELSWSYWGEDLTEVRDTKLYTGGWNTFEEYVAEQWGMSRAHAYALIDAAAVARNVRRVRHRLSLRAALRLRKLKDPEEQAACLSEAIAMAGTRRPTADQVAAAVAARLGKASREGAKARRKKPKPARLHLGPKDILTITASRAEALTALLTLPDAEILALLRGALEKLAAPKPASTPRT